MRGIDAEADAPHAAVQSPSEHPAGATVQRTRARKPDTRKRKRGMSDEARAAAAAARTAAAAARWAALQEDVEWMMRHGETREGIARRTGMQWDTLEKMFQRNGLPAPVPPGDYALVEALTHMKAVV